MSSQNFYELIINIQAFQKLVDLSSYPTFIMKARYQQTSNDLAAYKEHYLSYTFCKPSDYTRYLTKNNSITVTIYRSYSKMNGQSVFVSSNNIRLLITKLSISIEHILGNK